MTQKGPLLLYGKIYHLALSTCCLNMAITTYVYIVCIVYSSYNECSAGLVVVRTFIGGGWGIGNVTRRSSTNVPLLLLPHGLTSQGKGENMAEIVSMNI